MRICDLVDSITESFQQSRNEDDSVRQLKSGRMSGEMMSIADEVQRELDEELEDESDETFREAA